MEALQVVAENGLEFLSSATRRDGDPEVHACAEFLRGRFSAMNYIECKEGVDIFVSGWNAIPSKSSLRLGISNEF
jgi:hypothetical protein